MRALFLALLTLAGCGAAAPPPAPAPLVPPEVAERVNNLSQEIDQLGRRYETLQKQNAAIEKLLAKLGFGVQMTHETVQQRVDMMQRFERAEAARTATFHKLRTLLATLAAQHKVETSVEVRAGQIVVRIAESALFDAREHLRTEAAPLVWAVADGLKDLVGRRFEVVAEVRLPPPAKPDPAPPKAKAKKKAKPRKGKAAPAADTGWEGSARRVMEVVRMLEGAGIGAERLVACERGPDPAATSGAGGRFLEIIVLPTGDELPRVHTGK